MAEDGVFWFFSKRIPEYPGFTFIAYFCSEMQPNHAILHDFMASVVKMMCMIIQELKHQPLQRQTNEQT
jgi:hypothetical protein